MRTALSIAGSDCSGGAGIQADLKTMTMNGVYAMSVITALTAQNTMGVKAIMEASPEFLKQQIDAVFEDIYPDAVKIGMVSSMELIQVIVDRLRYYEAKNVVVDPVMVSTSGSRLLKEDAIQIIKIIGLSGKSDKLNGRKAAVVTWNRKAGGKGRPRFRCCRGFDAQRKMQTAAACERSVGTHKAQYQ